MDHHTGDTNYGASSHGELGAIADAITEIAAHLPAHSLHIVRVWFVVDATVDTHLLLRIARQPLHKATATSLDTQALLLWKALRSLPPYVELHIVKQDTPKPQDARRRRRDKRKSWYATPSPPHPQTNTRFLYRGRQQEAAQGTTSMLKKKKKHETAIHALSIGETQCGEVCYRRRSEKKKKKTREETQTTTRKKKTKTKNKKDLRTLFLNRGRKHDGTKGQVRTTHHTCHASLLRIYRTSSSAF